ncbi:ABC transporter ATP-binding protein [Natronobeatus ordinarius]|uniref:ABC transporter ATP-binding protein n=1 Tax=Natronobeatus ordinarius TaxID=2963433 RepID=UPI0020CEDF6A|nr:ABC transporter ATP-binding protein [Natronobeatus ordinarius]
MAAIELEGLTKDYGEVLANDGVTFDVAEGEIFGYLGPNGAGKTTTIRMLLGFISPTAGEGRVLGRDVTDERELIEAKRRIGYLPDDPQFDESSTGREILELHAGIKGDERSAELLELFDPPLDRPVREYSHGNVRKLGLVTTFMHDPDLVILDEPTSGLDPLMKQRFAEFVRNERDRGRTLFFSSHILGEVRRLCDRVGIIRSGKLVTVEPIDALLGRSGKVVRVVAADPIPRTVFERDLEGVHDLEAGFENERDVTAIGGGGRDESAGTDGIGAQVGAGKTDGTQDGTYREYTFTFTGNVDELLAVVSNYSYHDLTIEEAPLESVFLRFYGGEDDA